VTGKIEWLRKYRMLLLSASCLLFCVLLSVSMAGAAGNEFPKPAARDKCPVCGMFVAKYPDWVMVVLFRDGSRVFFDGAKDMIKYLLDIKRYDPARRTEDIQAVLVKDYYNLSPIDARKAWYVIGSDIYGPMGRELIPLEKEADAREFLNDHKGTKILKFSEINREVLKTLD
jgi:copper chaperone NosL